MAKRSILNYHFRRARRARLDPEDSIMRRYVARIALVLTLLSGAIAAQEAPPPPQVSAKTNLLDSMEQHEQYFSRIGKGKGTGFRQYARQLEFAKPRSYPSGDPLNYSALTLVHHLRAARSPEFQAMRAAGAAGGIVAKWTQVKPLEEPQGTDAGRINALAFDQSEPATVYAGTAAGGVWRTRDDGANWTPLTDSLPMLAVTDIAIDPKNPRTIYILTGDGEYVTIGVGINPPSIGVLKSVDGGESWDRTGLVWKIEQVEYGHR
jgi:hypothetical protein